MNRDLRLTRSTDFKRVRRDGKSYAHPLIILVAAANELPRTRFGVTTSRSYRSAVERNRAKRRLRHAIRPYADTTPEGWDLVFIARAELNRAEWPAIHGAIQSLLDEAGLSEED